jgi:hypothetical protein
VEKHASQGRYAAAVGGRWPWPAAATALFAAAALIYAMPTRGSDATRPPLPQERSQPALAVTSSPGAQTLETQVVALGEARKPTLVLGTARFTITVRNISPEQLIDITVVDPRTPACSRQIGLLGPGESVAYSCASENVGRDYTNVATASGRLRHADGTSAAPRALFVATATSVVKVKPKTRRRHVPHIAFTG